MDRAEIEKISKALADETRLRIFEAISATKHISCGEIVSMGNVTPATVSHHLKILSEAGLIVCRREGQFVYSQTVPETITAYARAIAKIVRGNKPARRRRLQQIIRQDFRETWNAPVARPGRSLDLGGYSQALRISCSRRSSRSSFRRHFGKTS